MKMAKKKKGQSGNGHNRKNSEAQKQAEQQKLHKTLRAYVRKIVNSSAVSDAIKTFDAAAQEFRKQFGGTKECREEIIRRVNLVLPLVCKCGHTEFSRQPGAQKVKCLKCKRLTSPTAHCPSFRSMKEPTLRLAFIWMKEQCPFFSIKKFAEEFGYQYSSCWLVARKVDLVLLEFTKGLKALEGIDTMLFINCFRRRSIKTPADSAPNAEQTLADEKFYGLSQSLPVSASKQNLSHPTRVNVAHLEAGQQQIYGLISSTPIGFDQLVEQSGLESAAVGGHLIRLELNNLISQLPGDRFVLAGYAPDQNPRQEAAKQHKPLDEPSKPPKFPNPSHKATADTICPLLLFLNNGFARKYLSMFVVEMWRASSLVIKAQPLPIFDLCVKLGSISRDDILQFECPNKIRIPIFA
jgi:hypothetical protein